jgi:hypothetical protein
MVGDNHTAYPGNSSCIDVAVEAYLEQNQLPPARTVCRQEVPFTQGAPALRASGQNVSTWAGRYAKPLP